MTPRTNKLGLTMAAWVPLVAALSLTAACGDDGGDGGGAMWSPDSCTWMEPDSQGSGTCSAMDLRAHTDCVVEACQEATARCFGENYLESSFEGPCAPLGQCAANCRCNDSACVSRCAYSEACDRCLFEQSSCSQSCGVPECVRGPLESLGVDTSVTCDDLRECCNRVYPDARTSCLEAVDLARGAGGSADWICASVARSYCELLRQR